MARLTVASVQMRLRLWASLDECREDLRRFLRAAEEKKARLVVFPEKAGVLVAPALLRDTRSGLLLRAAAGQQYQATVWERVRGSAAGWLAQALKVDIGDALGELLAHEPGRLLEAYMELFGALARDHGMTIVAPSAFLPDAGAPGVSNSTLVFGPGGDLLGRQSSVMPEATGTGAPTPRRKTWDAIPTEVGRLGIILGSDLFYPEAARVLVYQNAEVLLLQATCESESHYQAARTAILERMQENQVYAAASFLVGSDPFRAGGSAEYLGRSGLYAPRELTARPDGVLAEMGGAQSEGVVTAEWDYDILRALWQRADAPIQRPVASEQAGALIASIYAGLAVRPRPEDETTSDATPAILTQQAAEEVEALSAEATHDLEELPVLGSIISRWPLNASSAQTDEPATTEAVLDWPAAVAYEAAAGAHEIRRDDETDEMDAVNGADALAEPGEAETAESAVESGETAADSGVDELPGTATNTGPEEPSSSDANPVVDQSPGEDGYGSVDAGHGDSSPDNEDPRTSAAE